MEIVRYIPSARWIPEKFRGQDTSNFRYIPGLTERYRKKILAIAGDSQFKEQVLQYCPRKTAPGQWTVKNDNELEFLEMMGNFSPNEGRAACFVVDNHLTEELEENILIVRSKLRERDLDSLRSRWPTRKVKYEGETDVHYDLLGGPSLSLIETVEPKDHGHSGSRDLVSLSDDDTVDVLGNQYPLQKWDRAIQAPYIVHSYHGKFLTFHTGEPGWDHPEAILLYTPEKEEN